MRFLIGQGMRGACMPVDMMLHMAILLGAAKILQEERDGMHGKCKIDFSDS